MARHNFISQRIVDLMQIPLKETTNYGIVVGNGVVIRGKGVCKRLTLELSDLTVREDFLLVDLESVDLILGMQWLSMRYMGVDWAGLTMTFDREGEKVVIKGDSSLTKAEVSPKMMHRTWLESDQGFLVELRALNLEEDTDNSMTRE